jgi:D-glycero-D-manno-heptose 1,7-bisphosphate phosphatase
MRGPALLNSESTSLESIHQRMCVKLAALGAVISQDYYCPNELLPTCTCRKPSPGLLMTGSREHGIEPSAWWLIGDLYMEAGQMQDATWLHCESGR